MTRVIFLLEEPSMKTFLDTLLPRLFPDPLFQCVPPVSGPVPTGWVGTAHRSASATPIPWAHNGTA